MSIGPHLHTDEMELWQTPTWVTHLCALKAEGVGDTNWKNIKFRYSQWVRAHLDFLQPPTGWLPGDREALASRIKEHLEQLDSFKRLHFYIM